MPKYQTIKTYGNDRGFSCAFRQWRAESHCRLIHGYSLGFEFVLESITLDDKNWCYDYGNFKWIKQFLEENFDHKMAVAMDDPHLEKFYAMHVAGLIDINVLPSVGCEMFAKYVYDQVSQRIWNETSGRVRLVSVKVFEHGANAAVYEG